MSTNDFTNEYKKKVDALQTLYRFKGNVETLAELYSKTDNNIGDTWNCKEDGNNYTWNKEEWINIGTNIDLSGYATKEELSTKADKTELEEKADKTEITKLEDSIKKVADTVVTEVATTTQDGLFSKEDKKKLDEIENIEVIQKDGQASATNIYSAEAIDSIINYSTVETAVGKWIDGKTIYRKVVDIGNLPNATTKKIPHGIENIDKWIKLEGMYSNTTKTATSIPSIVAQEGYDAYQVSIELDIENIVIITGVDRSNFTGHIILEYTKTTDK